MSTETIRSYVGENRVIICIGTRNPAKIRGATNAFKRFFNVVEVKYINPSINLAPQPIGLENVIDGARRRALHAMDKIGDCSYGVGIEAGWILINGEYYDLEAAWIQRWDGVGSLGFSPAFKIPRLFAGKILDGSRKELEDVVNEYYGTENIGDKGGFIGVLTKNIITRSDLSYMATLMALIPFINEDLYIRGEDTR
ncbi:MAG: inosine/xanthosine triphosphatase [Desulfurococcus sp.]|jgi:inosine/xanthosine triphosphatase|uniref:inosine/xanthosine triphosphatase n=1 Tax=Desulfurococcus sp. TaxID=51678 RepID=UPI0031668E47